MRIVDANIILRYVLDDHAELSPKAAEILEQHEVTLPIEAACEVVYVLQKIYAVERAEIRQELSKLLNENLVSMEKPAVYSGPAFLDSKLSYSRPTHTIEAGNERAKA